MQQGKGSALPVMFGSAYYMKSHVSVKARALFVLLVHVNKLRAQVINSIVQKARSNALPSCCAVYKKHFDFFIRSGVYYPAAVWRLLFVLLTILW